MPKKIAPSFYFIGNNLALDFINTKVVADGKPVELFRASEDVWNWLLLTGSFTAEQVDPVTQWREEPTLVKEAIELRTSLHSIVRQRMLKAEVSMEDLERINLFLKSKAITTRMFSKEGQIASVRHIELQQPSDLLFPVAEAAVDLFTNFDFGLVKKCGNPDCVLYFYDNSKNSTRRWCSQKTCGNRMKVAAFMERRKREEAEKSKNPG